jgi:galactosamine-6-phosphate isomerase
MKIEVRDSYASLSESASEIIFNEIKARRKLLICAATGNTPVGTYACLAERYRQEPQLFDAIHILKLDEWGGLEMNDPATCEFFLQNHLIKPLHISGSRYISFNSNAPDPEGECKRVQAELDQRKPIDICILGLGLNGHIALNEPADLLTPMIHLAALSEKSIHHSMLSGLKNKPGYGLTLGMADILQSRMIIMMISGKEKKEICSAFLSGGITTRVPASFLWLHPNTICLISRDAME